MPSDAAATSARRHQLREELRGLSFDRLMRGTVVERRRRCGRPNCVCARSKKAWHSGQFLTVHLNGRTHALHLRPEDEPDVRAAIAAYSRLWEIINELTASELADLRRQARERKRARLRRTP